MSSHPPILTKTEFFLPYKQNSSSASLRPMTNQLVQIVLCISFINFLLYFWFFVKNPCFSIKFIIPIFSAHLLGYYQFFLCILDSSPDSKFTRLSSLSSSLFFLFLNVLAVLFVEVESLKKFSNLNKFSVFSDWTSFIFNAAFFLS